MSGPNVLLIVLDTTRASALSCYGYGKRTTPQIDRLASEGVRYDRAYATDFWTLPSHASLLTGMFPTECQATSETDHLPEDAVSLAERLKPRGFQTAGFVFNPWISRERGFAQGFDEYREMWKKENHPVGPLPRLGVEQAGGRRVVEWIEKHDPAKGPFFLFLNFNVAHLPYRPERGMLEKLSHQTWPAEKVKALGQIVGMWPHLAGKLKLSAEDYACLADLYAAEVGIDDVIVGEIIESLWSRGMLDETMVIVTADHGENIGDHGMIDHLLSMYETTIRVPLVIRYPKRFEAGRVEQDLVSLVDVVPSVLDVCGMLDGDAPGGAEHLSLCGGERRVRRGFVVAENDRPMNGIELMKKQHPEYDTSWMESRMRMLRDERYKLVWRDRGKIELYDLEDDPGETRDLSSLRTEVRDRMVGQMKEWMEEVRPGVQASPFSSKDEESLRRLRALGYIN